MAPKERVVLLALHYDNLETNNTPQLKPLNLKLLRAIGHLLDKNKIDEDVGFLVSIDKNEMVSFIDENGNELINKESIIDMEAVEVEAVEAHKKSSPARRTKKKEKQRKINKK